MVINQRLVIMVKMVINHALSNPIKKSNPLQWDLYSVLFRNQNLFYALG
jgi:hypothetical protein